MLNRHSSSLRRYPLEYVRLDPLSVLPNVIRHVGVDALMEANFNILVGTATEIPLRGAKILDMLAAALNGTSYEGIPHVFEDEIDLLCWHEVQRCLPNLSIDVQIIAKAGTGPYASPSAMSFCSRVLYMAKLGVPDPTSDDDIRSAWVRMFVGELLSSAEFAGSGSSGRTRRRLRVGRRSRRQRSRPTSGFLAPAVGYVGLDARQSPEGDWRTVVVYNSDDFEHPEVKANHYFSRSPEIVYAMIMQDDGGEFYAYITRDWELPDGGNIMQVTPENAENLIRLGMEPYPMLHSDPYGGYIVRDKSRILQTDPVPPMPTDSMEEIAHMLGVIDRSGWLTDRESWVELVGNPISGMA